MPSPGRGLIAAGVKSAILSTDFNRMGYAVPACLSMNDNGEIAVAGVMAQEWSDGFRMAAV